ncbi:MAG: GFA family protein [Myxococcales bacterium]|nr:GFA family protein [Myxococcales bacterium]MCB9717547.1 GFA family protein [Myxococcales bacterium]
MTESASAATESKREGGCLCGAVRFEITLPSKWCAHCHCSMCRRAHGAGVVTWFGVPEDRFRITAGEELLVRFASSERAWRGFCGRCGSTMLFGGERWPGEVHVALANLEGELDRKPVANVYWDVRVPWVEGIEHLPKLGGEQGNQPLKE